MSIPRKSTNGRLMSVLDYLEINGPQKMQDVAEKLGIGLCTMKRDMQRLEKCHCITSKIVFTGMSGSKVCTYVRRDTFVPLREPAQPKKSHNYIPTGGTIHRFLGQPERPRPLRKINTAWMGYQSGLEAA
jgi:predicted transcriptional regulator